MEPGIAEYVRLSPAVWPGDPLAIQPGNLGLVAAQGGEGGSSPSGAPETSPLAPYLSAESGRFFCFRAQSGRAIADAPFERPAGGTIYFDGNTTNELLDATMNVMQVANLSQYAAFLEHAPNLSSGYLTQLRIVSPDALRYVFGISSDAVEETIVQQPMSACELTLKFVQHYRGEWGRRRYPSRETHPGVSGANALGESVGYETFDGVPGRNADEYLGFGLMVENAVYPIYRVWTRPWFAHK